MKLFRTQIIALALSAAFAANAHAAIFIVGTGTGCTHNSIQAAINAATSSPDTDTVRVTRSLAYTAQAITINTSQELTIEGGYATCDQASPDTTNTVVSGTGGSQASVFSITTATGALIHMRRLTISGGDASGGSKGGGIYFYGDGILDLVHTFITQNSAGFGGGIYAQGNGSHTELVLGADVVISNNTARFSGGGVMSYGVETSISGIGTSILLNDALGNNNTGGYGGGLYVYAGDRPSYAYVGSGSALGSVIFLNSAVYGGGVAIVSAGTDAAELQLYSDTTDNRAAIKSNSASSVGGGIYVSSAKANARLWNAALDDNLAPNGAAAYMATGSGFYFNFNPLPPSAVTCTAGYDCGLITNNNANTDTNPGAIIFGESGTTIQFNRPAAIGLPLFGGVQIQGNTAGSIFAGSADEALTGAVIGNNTTSQDLISHSNQSLYLGDTTIGGNTIGGGSAILRTVNSDVMISRSILWQPGVTSMSRNGGSLTIDRTDASENGSLGGAFAVYTFAPRFVDPEHGDFGLRAGSGAIDFAQSLGVANELDTYDLPRDKDLPNVNNPGPRDIGALERQSLQPMVLNADFDHSDLRLWTKFQGAWDGTQNAVGGTNSGSWHFDSDGGNQPEFVVGQQCIQLPAPGRYLVNGWGKGGGSSMATRDYAILDWQLRYAGGEGCNLAPIDATGQLRLGGGTSWQHPAQPAIIDVDPTQFGAATSIVITLIARDNSNVAPRSISVWFDGITLDLESDTIFKNGFE
jgi:hypothetical protein